MIVKVYQIMAKVPYEVMRINLTLKLKKKDWKRYWMNVYHVGNMPTSSVMSVNHQGVLYAMNNGTSIPRGRTIKPVYVQS